MWFYNINIVLKLSYTIFANFLLKLIENNNNYWNL